MKLSDFSWLLFDAKQLESIAFTLSLDTTIGDTWFHVHFDTRGKVWAILSLKKGDTNGRRRTPGDPDLNQDELDIIANPDKFDWKIGDWCLVRHYIGAVRTILKSMRTRVRNFDQNPDEED